MLLVKLDISMKKKANRYISITSHKNQNSMWMENLIKSVTLYLIKHKGEYL